MSEVKHTATPGPYVVGTLEGTETLCIATEGGGVIAVMGGAPRRWIEADANKLAASDDMLKALEGLIEDVERTRSDFWGLPTQVRNSSVAKAEAAISKAKGDV